MNRLIFISLFFLNFMGAPNPAFSQYSRLIIEHSLSDPSKFTIIDKDSLDAALGIPKIAEEKINPFIQPQNTTAYYGSGDINLDGIVSIEDYNELKNNLSKSSIKDLADVNGDGTVNNSDLTLLKQYIDGSLNNLPGHWNELTSIDQRKSWVEKMMAIDRTDKLPYIANNREWVCEHFALQTFVNFYGNIENLPEKFNKNYISRFNLPVYYIGINYGPDQSGHAINAILIGNDALDYTNWLFIEPQTDAIVDIKYVIHKVISFYIEKPINFEEDRGIFSGDVLVSFSSSNDSYVFESRHYHEYLQAIKPEIQGTIAGRVLDSLSNKPVTALITFESSTRKLPIVANNGEFSMNVCADQNYRITARRTNYSTTIKEGISVDIGAHIYTDLLIDPSSSNVVAYYHFDGDCLDATGHGNDLIMEEDNIQWVEGKYGKAIIANNYNSLSIDGFNICYPGDGDWTVEAWIKVNRESSTIIGAYYYVEELDRVIWYGNSFGLSISNDSVSFNCGDWLSSETTVKTDDWIHVAGVYRYNKSMQLYLNGQLLSEKETDEIPILYPYSTYHIGRGVDLDELRICEKALEPEEFLGFSKISGTVADASGLLLPNVIVSTTPGDFRTITDANGKYTLLLGGESVYTIKTWRAGYSTETNSNVFIPSETETEINFELKPSTNPIVVRYDFNENGTDKSGNGFNLIYNPEDVTWTEGKFGRAVRGEVQAPGYGIYYPGDCDWTVEAWVKTEDFDGNWFITGNSYVITLYADEDIDFGINNGKEYIWTPGISIYYLKGEWFHIAGVYKKKESMKIYINGQLQYEKSTTEIPYTDFLKNLRIGNDETEIDELRITAAALEPSEFIGFTEVAGIVTNNSNNPLKNTSVSVLNGDYKTITDSEGHYSLLLAGGSEYTIKAWRAGYSAQIQSDIFVPIDGTMELNFNLEQSVSPTVAYYDFNENGIDKSGNGFDLIYNSEDVTWTEGKYGKAVRGEVQAPGYGIYYPGDCDWTVEAWVKKIEYSNNWFISGNSYKLVLWNNGNVDIASFDIWQGEGKSDQIGAVIEKNNDEWLHVAGVYRCNKSMQVYLNGQLESENMTTVYPSTDLHNLFIGYDEEIEIDELRISASALAPEHFIGFSAIAGRVTDVTGSPIPNALITVIPNGISMYSDNDGQYKIVVTGDTTYSVTVEKENYITVSESEVHINKNETKTLDITLTSQSPLLAINPRKINFADSVTIQNIEIWNSGSKTLRYTLSCYPSNSWLGVNPKSGESSGVHNVIDVSVNRSGLESGSYSGYITFTTESGEIQTVAITMSVPEPILLVSEFKQNDMQNEYKLDIMNSGGGILKYTFVCSDLWFTVEPVSGAIGSTELKEQHTLLIDKTNLTGGKHQGQLIITSNGENDTLMVSTEVLPVIGVSTTRIECGIISGIDSLNVWNEGEGILRYIFNVTEGKDVFSIEPAEGESKNIDDKKSHTVMVNYDNIGAGQTKEGLIILTCVDIHESTKAIELFATNQPSIAFDFLDHDTIDFGTTKNTYDLDIWNAGTGTLAYNASVGDEFDCFTISPVRGESKGSDDKILHQIRLDRVKLQPGQIVKGLLTLSSDVAENSPMEIELNAIGKPESYVSIFQNPGLQSYIHFGVNVNSVTTIENNNIKLLVNNKTIDLDSLEVNSWYGSYKMDTPGKFNLYIIAFGDTLSTKHYSVGFVAKEGGYGVSYDDVVRIDFEPNCVDDEMFFAIYNSENKSDVENNSYEIGSEDFHLKKTATIGFRQENGYLSVYHLKTDGWKELPTTYENGEFIAKTDELGTFKLSPASPVAYPSRIVGNFPNPFNTQTTIEISLGMETSNKIVQVCIYNLNGQRIKILLDKPMNPGFHKIMWDGVDNRGNQVSSGIYLYKLNVGSTIDTGKMLFIK